MLTCEFENGSRAELRHVTVDVVLRRDREVLLARRAERLMEGKKWSVPGGYLDRNETVEEGAAREVLEETGFRCRDMQLLDVFSNPDRPGDDRQNVSFVFSAEAGEQTGTPDDEVTETKWFPIDQLPPSAELAFDHERMLRVWIERTAG